MRRGHEPCLIVVKCKNFPETSLEVPGRYASPQLFNETDILHFACLPTIPLLMSDLFAQSPDTSL